MTRVGLAVHRTFHSLHTRNFRLFFIGQAVSVEVDAADVKPY